MTMLTELLISGGTYNYVWPYANGREMGRQWSRSLRPCWTQS